MLELLGIGLGKVELSLERVVYVPGDRVRGRLRWSLKTPTAARRVAVGLYAKQRVVSVHREHGARTVGHRSDTVYRFEQSLAGEDIYTSGDREFELVIPSDVLRSSIVDPPPGLLGDVVRVVSFLSSDKRFPLEWEVRGFVDVPFKINPKTAMSITVTERVNP